MWPLLILTLLVVIQASLGDLLRLAQWSPDLMLVGVLWLLPGRSLPQAALLGFLAGLLLDLLGTDPFGAGALAGCSAAFFGALWIDPARPLVLPFRMLRALAILLPLHLMLGALRYYGLEGDPWQRVYTVYLPASLYSWACFVVLSLLPLRSGSREA